MNEVPVGLLAEGTWTFYGATFLCLLLGVALSYLGELRRLNALARAQHEPPVHWKEYYRDFPYATLFSVLSSILGYFMLIGLDELSIVTAIGMGFIGEAVSDTASARAKHAIGLSTSGYQPRGEDPDG